MAKAARKTDTKILITLIPRKNQTWHKITNIADSKKNTPQNQFLFFIVAPFI